MNRKLTLKEIQQIEFDILVEFDRICTQYNLRYSLDSGTLIGAIRHKDFIPWDDDVDIIMPRPDYEEMCKIAPKEFPKRYKILRNSYWPFVKISDLHTKIITNNSKTLYAENHLWIDIFPVDGLPFDEKNIVQLFAQVRKLRGQQFRARVIIGTGSTPIRAIAKIPLSLLPKIHGTVYYTRKIEEKLNQNSFKTSKWVSSVVAYFETNGEVRLRREEFDNLIKLPFHGKEFWAIPSWDNYLRSYYGDYMQLPPEEERKVHLQDAWLEDEIKE